MAQRLRHKALEVEVVMPQKRILATAVLLRYFVQVPHNWALSHCVSLLTMYSIHTTYRVIVFYI